MKEPKEFLFRFTIEVMGEDEDHAKDRLEQDFSDTMKQGANLTDIFEIEKVTKTKGKKSK